MEPMFKINWPGLVTGEKNGTLTALSWWGWLRMQELWSKFFMYYGILHF
jgi:hypothetical protein